jgi:hypothetical protein
LIEGISILCQLELTHSYKHAEHETIQSTVQF